MNFVYSANNNMFYPYEYKKQYENNGDWPNDGIDITDAIFTEFTGKAPEGKTRMAGVDGLPTWGDVPQPTQDDLIAAAELTKSVLRTKADDEIVWRKDAVSAGIATDKESDELLEWEKYRVLLMRVDTAKPEWPAVPGDEAN